MLLMPSLSAVGVNENMSGNVRRTQTTRQATTLACIMFMRRGAFLEVPVIVVS